MSYRYWQDSELYNHVKASQAAQPQVTADDGQLTQQSYLDSTSNDQVLAPVGLHDVGLSQSDISGPLLSDVSVPLPLLDRQVDQPNVHSAAGRPSHDSLSTQIPCLWTNHQSQCDFSADTIQNMLTHISSQHLPKRQPSASKVECHILSPS